MKARDCRVLAVVVVGLASAPLAAQDPADLGERSRLMSRAFQCSVWADTAGRSEEADRLFDIGYEAGKDYVEALRINPSVDPAGTEYELTLGPSADFVLGRRFEVLSKISLAIVGAGEPPTTAEESARVREAAEFVYQQANCSEIGRD
jgi:hypothetical protein